MVETIRILNWNTQIASPRSRSNRFKQIQQTILKYQADVVCLTEAYPETMPDNGHTITSGLAGWGDYEKNGARKVVLWGKHAWTAIDAIGSDNLPEGRFISAVATIQGVDLRFAGMCIPYHDYRNNAKSGDKRKSQWQGACEYLDVLRQEILPKPNFSKRTILLGDFNLQIPPKNYPYPSASVNQKRENTFKGWHIPTSGEIDDPALDKRFIDHIALTADIEPVSMQFISRFDPSGKPLSDHNGVCIDIKI